MSKERVLVTGASSGIGWDLAKLFAADGSDLVLVARSEDKLRELAAELEKSSGVSCRVLPKDLTRAEAPEEIFRELTDAGVQVDVLVNNAGFGATGAVDQIDTSRQLEMIQVNVTALTHLTRLFLPGMRARKRGGILNVASTAAFQPGPRMAVYYATKAYVLSFTEALAEEVAGAGIAVSCLCPGPTVTGFGADSGMDQSIIFKVGVMDQRTVALAGHAGLRQGRVIVIPGLKNWLGAVATRFAPRFLVRKIVNSLNA